MKQVVLSFDADFTDYISGKALDEFGCYFEDFRNLFLEFPQVVSTWFLRIDADMQRIWGERDFVFKRYAEQIEFLRMRGHEVGLHFHSYVQRDDAWVQNGNEDSVHEEFNISLDLAKKYALKGCRMGWGYQRNGIMRSLAENGFVYDSSAMPRPKYPWETQICDWEGTGDQPYFPSEKDYRIFGMNARDIIEIPIPMPKIKANGDTVEMQRYINPAYRHSDFVGAMENCDSHTPVVVLHPYEAFSNEGEHALIAFSFSDFRKNIVWLLEQGYRFITLLNLAKESKDQIALKQ